MTKQISILLLFIFSASLSLYSQSLEISNKHKSMHESLLTNIQNPLDRNKNMLKGYLLDEILEREEEDSISDETAMLIEDVIKEAHKYIGVRYRHGAKGPKAFDCSGFTSYVYRQFGYELSPSSRHQYTQGVPVKKNELRRGDLVFFTSPRSGKNVGHVGIVVTADNEKGTFTFIHASIKGVKVSENKGYYAPRYVGAKRVITD